MTLVLAVADNKDREVIFVHNPHKCRRRTGFKLRRDVAYAGKREFFKLVYIRTRQIRRQYQIGGKLVGMSFGIERPASETANIALAAE